MERIVIENSYSEYRHDTELDVPGILKYFEEVDLQKFPLQPLEDEDPASKPLFTLLYFCHEAAIGFENCSRLIGLTPGHYVFNTRATDAYDFAYRIGITVDPKIDFLSKVSLIEKILGKLIPLNVLNAKGFQRDSEEITKEELSIFKDFIEEIRQKLGLQGVICWKGSDEDLCAYQDILLE